MKHESARYTLIELLVTIAIIGILATLLLSVMRSSQEKAKELNCNNNLKNLGVLIADYTADNSGAYPLDDSDGNTWDNVLSSYDGRNLTVEEMADPLVQTDSDLGRGQELYQCENDTITRGNGYKRTYAMNGLKTGRDSDGSLKLYGISSDSTGRRVADIADPAGTILLAEFAFTESELAGAFGSSLPNPGQQIVWGGSGLTAQTGLTGLHGEYQFNYLFTDLHVKRHYIQDTVTDANYSQNSRNIKGMWTVEAGD